jgi:hypothetical protein
MSGPVFAFILCSPEGAREKFGQNSGFGRAHNRDFAA